MTNGGTWNQRATAAGLAMVTTIFTTGGVVAAQADGRDQVPPTVDGEVIYVPWSPSGDIGITIDGDLADWADVPSFVTTTGPMPSADPATNGELTWSIAAEESRLYVSATITDDSIIAGEHGEGYWNEDSIEVYLNATDNLDPMSYGPGIAQVRFSAVDIGNTDPAALTLSGTNIETFAVEGFAFATPNGWGIEGVIDFSEWIEPSHGVSLGFQMHANGASTSDRDLKLIWSAADVDDLSFERPSVFGTAVLFELGQTDVPAPAVRVEPSATPSTEPVSPADEETEPDQSTTTTAPATTTTDAGEGTEQTEDTAVVDDAASPITTTGDSDWRDSPLLWITPLALGAASLVAFAVERLRSSKVEDDPTDPPLG